MCDSSSYLKACDNFFKYIFKEEIIDINEEILFSLLENSLKKNCELENLNENHLFHSRFCGIRYKNVLINLIKEKIIICNSEIN
jgi:hypothetical protein